jgi:PAS domain S-box-containing protein
MAISPTLLALLITLSAVLIAVATLVATFAGRQGELASSLSAEISRRKRTEEDLRRSEAYLAQAQKLTQTGSWVWDARTRMVLHCSEEMFRIFGVDPREIPSRKTFRQRVHPEDRDRVDQRFERSIRQKVDSFDEYRVLLPDGKVRHVNSSGHPVLDEHGELIEFVGTTVDVTERKKADEALRRSEAYLAEAQRLAHTGSWAKNPHTNELLYGSDELLRIFGLDPEQGMPPAETFTARIHPEDLGRAEGLAQEALRRKTDYINNYRIVLPDGTVRHIEATGHPLFDAHGEVVEYVGTAVDVTERKRAEEERERLRQLEADLAHLNRVTTMGELTASLAHEISQPIAAAITNANSCVRWLSREPPDLQEAREAAARISRDGTRATEIIRRLRAFYKKGESLQRELMDVNEVAGEILMLLRSEAFRHSIAMRTDFVPALPKVMADRVQLQQVFMNLILNGIEAMRETAGELTIRSQLGDDGQLLISVRDTGVGLPGGNADQMFDAFFTTKPQGTGMGLAITRSIIESHGGRLWAAPNSGPGATFYFTLPREEQRSR